MTQQLERCRLDRLAERCRAGDRDGEQGETDHRPGDRQPEPAGDGLADELEDEEGGDGDQHGWIPKKRLAA